GGEFGFRLDKNLPEFLEIHAQQGVSLPRGTSSRLDALFDEGLGQGIRDVCGQLWVAGGARNPDNAAASRGQNVQVLLHFLERRAWRGRQQRNPGTCW